jgi:gas vesicle protein
MKTRKKFSISFTIITFLIAGLFVSCQQGENIDDKVQSEVEDLRDNLNDLSTDDSNFADNLHSELEDFEESMNDVKEDMNETGEQISMEVRQAVNDLQAEARSLRMKLERRTQAGDDNSGFAW